jgi:nicotinamidase-related amidase
MPHPSKHPDLHGNVPDQCAVALVLIDVLNALEFEGGESLAPRALEISRRLLSLRQRAVEAGVPVVYVNDNAGRWRSDLGGVIQTATHSGAPGAESSCLLLPGPYDYVILKPKHSGFYATPLDTLLTYLGVERLILTGFSAERCVLFTANDAFLRDFELFVPSDCMAAVDAEDTAAALRILERVLGAETTPSPELDLEALKVPRGAPAS